MPGESGFMTHVLISVLEPLPSDPMGECHEIGVVQAEKTRQGLCKQGATCACSPRFLLDFSPAHGDPPFLIIICFPCGTCVPKRPEQSTHYVAHDIDELPSVCGTGCSSDLFPIQNLRPQTGRMIEVDGYLMRAVRRRRIVSDTVLYRLSVSDMEAYRVM